VNTNLETHLQDYDCHLVWYETRHEELRALDKDLPSDTHLVRYFIANVEFVSGIRAFKMVDIFDALTDLGAEVREITQGYGAIKPKLWGYQSTTEED